jgi:hypothetical protein
MLFHLEERRKLARQPGETDADLDAQLFARYAHELAAIPDAQAIPDKTEFAFWKRVLRSAERTARGSPRDADDGRLSRRELDEARTIRNRVYGRCPHAPRCRSEEDCIRAIAMERREAAS